MGRRAKRRGKRPAGSIVRPNGKAGPQIIDSTGPRWTEAHETIFLDELGASCNVTRACRAIKFSNTALYSRRRTDAGFKERWDAALAQGYVRVEMALLRRAEEAAEGSVPDPRIPIAPMTVKEALSLLQMHRASVTGQGAPRGRRPLPRALDDVRAEIIAKLEAIEVARRLEGEGGGEDGSGGAGRDDA